MNISLENCWTKIKEKNFVHLNKQIFIFILQKYFSMHHFTNQPININYSRNHGIWQNLHQLWKNCLSLGSKQHFNMKEITETLLVTDNRPLYLSYWIITFLAYNVQSKYCAYILFLYLSSWYEEKKTFYTWMLHSCNNLRMIT